MMRPSLSALLCFLPLGLACGGDDPAPAPSAAAGQGGSAGSAGESGGASGRGATAGRGGTTGGPDVCDTGSCLACTVCINQETCKQPYQACFENNPGCVSLSQCYLGCTDAACRDSCTAQADEPSKKAARAYFDCSLCDACQTVCGRDPSCDR